MKETLISKEKNEAVFKMEFSKEEFEEGLQKAYQENKGKYSVDGFRKGKAPRKIIETRYGEEVFYDEAIDILITKGYDDAIKSLNLRPVGRPEAKLDEIDKEKGFDVEIKVEVFPDFEVKDYLGVEIDKIVEKVEEKNVDEELQKLKIRNTRMVNVERPVQEGDTVLLDYEGTVDGVAFEGGTSQGFPLKIGSKTFIPGFEEQLVGANKGDTVDVKTSFPEDYHVDYLKGKEAIFKCVLQEVKEEEEPVLDDEFAKDVSEWDTLEDLKKELRENLEKKAEKDAEIKMKDKVLEKIYEANSIDIPNVMIEDEIDNMLSEFEGQLKYQGLDLDKYLAVLGKELKDFREDLRKDGERRVKMRMLMERIAELEKVEATEEELDKQFELLGMQYQMDKEKVREMLGEANADLFRREIKMGKATDLVFEKAVIKEN
ncbi:MAG: trigger factor [Anaerovoracaceae bacterium]